METGTRSSPQVVELRQKASELKNERDAANSEVKRMALERKGKVEELKALFDELKAAREKRDAASAKAREAKEKRNELHFKLKAEGKDFNDLREASKELKGVDRRSIERELSARRRGMQAKYISPNKEDELIEELEALEAQLETFEKVERARQEARGETEELRKLRASASEFHSAVLESAKESDEHHLKVKETLSRIDALRSELDASRDAFKEKRALANAKHAELLKVYDSLKALDAERVKAYAERHVRSEERPPAKPTFNPEATVKEALERLKKGEKVDMTGLFAGQ